MIIDNCIEFKMENNVMIIIGDNDCTMRNFFFISEQLKKIVENQNKCIILLDRVNYCNSSFISFVVSLIGHMNRKGIEYEIKLSQYLMKIFGELHVLTFFKGRII
jgi:hypothetical protein